MSLDLEPLTAATLPAFRELLGGAAFGGCFCAVWTAHGPDWAARCADPAQPNYRVTAERVRAGEHVGFLVREAGRVVAWCGAGPKPCFPALGTRLGARLTPSSDAVWAIGCLALSEGFRGQGNAARVIEAVVARAREAGAAAIEAYPTDPWDEPRSYRGALTTYLRLGFAEVARERDDSASLVVVRATQGTG
ncbi:MAG: GNAT family N-acetyltransferase [Planctomycetota bacterium]